MRGQGIQDGSYLLGHFVFAVCLAVRETLFKWLLLWLGAIYLASGIAYSLIALANPGNLAADPPIVGIFLIALFIYSPLIRARARARASSIVKSDMQAYNALWENAVRQDASEGCALEELETLAASLPSGVGASRQRMRVDPVARSSFLERLPSGCDGAVEIGVPVANLGFDQDADAAEEAAAPARQSMLRRFGHSVQTCKSCSLS